MLAELPRRIHDWMPRLAEEGVVGADAIFACLGPALEIFSRYSRVEKASGEVVPLKEYLESVWAAVSHEALSMIFAGASTEGFEPDARLTAMWLWTLNSNGKESTAEDAEMQRKKILRETAISAFLRVLRGETRIHSGIRCRPKNRPGAWPPGTVDGVVEVKGDKARLLPVAERTKHLFGKEEASAPTNRKKKSPHKKPSLTHWRRSRRRQAVGARERARTGQHGVGLYPPEHDIVCRRTERRRSSGSSLRTVLAGTPATGGWRRLLCSLSPRHRRETLGRWRAGS